MKTKLLIPLLSLLLISCVDNTARKKHEEEQRQAMEAYRHNYRIAESLYGIAEIHGLRIDKKDFHQSMESPKNAEIFLNNLLEAGILLDEKKDILFWINQLYDGIPPELRHLDLWRGIDTTQQREGSLSHLIDEPEWIKNSLN